MDALIDAVKAHALENYESGGWDVVVECWEDKEIQDHLLHSGATTKADAIDSFRFMVDVWADRQADARNSVF